MPFLHARKQSLVVDENIRIRDRLVRFLDSSHDKEHDDAQGLQIGVSMAKLQPLLLNHCKFFMKCINFYNALYCRFLYAPLCWVFAYRVTNNNEFIYNVS